MDDLIFKILSAKEPCANDVVALIKECLNAGKSVYRTMNELTYALNDGGERIAMSGLGANGAFCVQIHNDGTPCYAIDLFLPCIDSVTSPNLNIQLSCDWHNIERVVEFTAVNTRDEYDEWTQRARDRYVKNTNVA